MCINTGTIPSKTLREAVLHLSGYRERGLYGASYTVKEKITIDDLVFRTGRVISNEVDVTRHQLLRNHVELVAARASFVDPHTMRLSSVDSHGQREVTAAKVIIATGTVATQEEHIPFDQRRIFISDDILRLDCLPYTLTVVGAGVIGCEYASIFAALGVRVTLVDQRPRLLPFVDAEIVEALTYQLRQNRLTLRLGETVSGIEPIEDERGERVKILLESGKQIVTEKALYSIGRTGATHDLDLPAAGLEADGRGRLKVNGHSSTAVPHIYAVGDVIGFPSLSRSQIRSRSDQ